MEFLITQASTFAKDIDDLILLVFAITGVWMFIFQFVFLYFIFKYRRSKNPKASYITGEEPTSKKVSHWVDFTIIAFDIVIIFYAISVWYKVKQDIPTPDETVRIVGYQWAWKFVHPGPDKILDTEDDIETVDDLYLRKDTLYNFKLTSEDVLHSFSIPVFRLKQDSIPGREITGWFEPTKEGEYDLQCAEICGIGHGVMNAKVHIYSEEKYNEWLASNSPGFVSPAQTAALK